MFLRVLQKTSMSTRFTAEKQSHVSQRHEELLAKCRILCRHCTWSEYGVLIGFSKFTLLLSFKVILTSKPILYGIYVDLKQICTCFLVVLKKLLVMSVFSTTRFGQSALSVALIWFAVVRPLGYLLHEISRDTLAHAIHSAKHGTESCIQRGEEGGLQGQSATIYW